MRPLLLAPTSVRYSAGSRYGPMFRVPRALIRACSGSSCLTVAQRPGSLHILPAAQCWVDSSCRWQACATFTSAPAPYRFSPRARCEDKDWVQLSPQEHVAAKGLGWSPESWDGDVEHAKDDWEDLSKEERAWAIELGFTRKIWNTPFLGVFWDELGEEKQVGALRLCHR